MNKQILFISGLFAFGILVGIVMMSSRDEEQLTPVTSSGNLSVVDAGTSQPSPASQATGGGVDFGHIQAIEDKVAALEARISELEQAVVSRPEVSTNTQPSRVNARANRLSRLLTTKTLVKAGLSEDIAAGIVRRRNDIELKKLELHDSASREGYLGTARYSRELAALATEEISLREELGDDVYEQYLYANGLPNRVKVVSVMLGSMAEEAGMKDGDLVLTYGQQRVFEWSELVNATSEGERGEYVNVDILRNGQLMSLSVLRGPLGVRLSSARVAP